MSAIRSKSEYACDTKKCLGKGTFGVVYEGQNKKTNERVAMKQCIVVEDVQGCVAMKEIKSLHHIAPHKHIVKLLDFSYSNNSFWIVMEYCDKGDLSNYMKKYVPNLDQQLKIMHQCAGAIEYMHSLRQPVVHRDIKPGNILFKTEGKSVIVKISDFGLAKIVDDEKSKSVAGMSTVQGTKPFMAPELWAGKKYNYTVDTFALGMVFLAMINYNPADPKLVPLSVTFLQSVDSDRDITYVGQEMYEANLKRNKPPVVIKTSPLDSQKLKAVKTIIIGMSDPDPSKRMPMAKVLAEIESVAAGATTKGMVLGKAKAAELFQSNLDITQTKCCFDEDPDLSVLPGTKSSGYGSGGSGSGSGKGSSGGGAVVRKPGGERRETGRPASEEPDLGYLLMRQMVEDHVRRKREEALKEKKARDEAEKMAAALPMLLLLKLMESDSESAKKFEVGDKVLIDDDYVKAKQLQINHGGWDDKMKPYLGKEATVKEIKDGRITVMFSNGNTFMWNAKLLEPVDERSPRKGDEWAHSKFKRYDLVKIKVDARELERLQHKGTAGWRDSMKNAIGLRGIVNRIHHDGDVAVEFINGDKWWLNPDAIEKVDTSHMDLEAGDRVIVLDDRKEVQRLQKGHGEWVDGMQQCLGKSGIVKKVSSNNRAIVEVGSTSFIWNQQCLKIFAKSEEMMLVMFRKRLLVK